MDFQTFFFKMDNIIMIIVLLIVLYHTHVAINIAAYFVQTLATVVVKGHCSEDALFLF